MATAASYLFRSLGGVIGVSFGNTIEQQVLRKNLKEGLNGENIDEVRDFFSRNLRASIRSTASVRSSDVSGSH